MMEALWIIPAAFVVLLLIVLVRTLRFKPQKQAKDDIPEIEINRERAARNLADMICCKTVSNRDEEAIDHAEFERFRNLLKDRYPNVYSSCQVDHIGKTGLVYYLAGDSSDNPTVCMAHYDVVPADSDGWINPPFSGLIEDGVIWGRGAIDTKSTLCGVMEALEHLLQGSYKPKQDLYLCFSGEEEIDGDTCPDIVSYLEKKGVKPALVLDEGGAVVSNVFPGVSKECAVVGIAEKGGVNLQFTLESSGGHASTPPVHTVLGKLSKAVTLIENNPFKYQLTKPVLEMFDTLGRYSTFVYRMIFANLWLFAPVLDIICKKSGGEINALMRTTVAVTRMEGSNAYNVLPPKAGFGINMRLLGDDNIDSAIEYLKGVIKNPDIKIDIVNGMNPSICSDINCGAWQILGRAIKQTWPGVIVSPYLMMACSDSRHYCRITDKVYRFSAMRLSKEERAMVHGNNERIPVETLCKTVEFYIRLLKLI